MCIYIYMCVCVCICICSNLQTCPPPPSPQGLESRLFWRNRVVLWRKINRQVIVQNTSDSTNTLMTRHASLTHPSHSGKPVQTYPWFSSPLLRLATGIHIHMLPGSHHSQVPVSVSTKKVNQILFRYWSICKHPSISRKSKLICFLVMEINTNEVPWKDTFETIYRSRTRSRLYT